jgi:hypothetical protein
MKEMKWEEDSFGLQADSSTLNDRVWRSEFIIFMYSYILLLIDTLKYIV